MHEFSLCQNIVSIVSNKAGDNDINVKDIVIKVGDIASVDLDSLCFWFPVAIKDTNLRDAKLQVIHQNAVAKCNICHEEFAVKQLYEACPKCDSYDKKILSGQELTVESIIYKQEI
jgi:hydrogenase nickel incorporation protein HypA/HybF